MSRLLLVGAGAAGLWAIGATGAGAQSAQELQAIQAQIEQMQATIKSLQKQVQDAQAQAASAQAAASSGGMSDIDLKVKWKGAPELSSSDGKFKMKVRGRIMTDYNGIDQDFDITGWPDVSGVELRRARLGVEGVVFYDVKYKFEVDFAGDQTAVKDAYLAYAGLKPKSWGMGEIRFGNQYVYNSLEQITSSRFITFMERAAYQEAFFLDRQIGAGILAGTDHWSFQTGVYGAPSAEQDTFFTDQVAYSARMTVAPINREVNGVNQVLHLGVSGRHRDAAENDRGGPRFGPFEDQLYRYRARGADLHLAQRFVATAFIADSDDMLNLEAAFVWGPFSMQGEYAKLWTETAPFLNTVDPEYTGWYVDASLFLTGESRNYAGDEGIFDRVKVKRPVFRGSGGWGAWQIAGRYDVIDLSDRNNVLSLGCQFCGEQSTWLIGVNWHLNDYTRFMLNVTQSKIEGGNGGNPPTAGFNRNNGAEINGVGLRAQVDW